MPRTVIIKVPFASRLPDSSELGTGLITTRVHWIGNACQLLAPFLERDGWSRSDFPAPAPVRPISTVLSFVRFFLPALHFLLRERFRLNLFGCGGRAALCLVGSLGKRSPISGGLFLSDRPLGRSPGRERESLEKAAPFATGTAERKDCDISADGRFTTVAARSVSGHCRDWDRHHTLLVRLRGLSKKDCSNGISAAFTVRGSPSVYECEDSEATGRGRFRFASLTFTDRTEVTGIFKNCSLVLQIQVKSMRKPRVEPRSAARSK